MSNIINLRYVCLTTTTASYVDEDYIRNNKIKLLTIPKYSTNSVAEYLVFLMMCLAKKLPLQLKNDCKQDFFDEFLQMELTGKQVGVVGLGNIGNRICEITEGMGMVPTYWNRSPKESRFISLELDELFKKSDVIFITLANNQDTKQIVTKKLLNLLKPTAIFISGTGIALHDDKIIRKMLSNGKLFGVGLEEFMDMTDVPERLINHPKVTCTFHRAYNTVEAEENRLNMCIDNIEAFLKGKPINLIKF